MLAHIGYSEKSRKIWVPFARNSGNMKFKTTAIKALTQIGKVSEDPADLEYAVNEIVELTRGGRLHDVVPEALSAMKELLVFIDETDLKKGNDSTELIEKTVAMLESISTDLVSGGLSEEAVGTAVEATGLDDAQVLAIKEESARMAQELGARLPSEREGGIMDEVKKRVKELQSGDEAERRSAERTLARAGSKAVPSLFETYEQSKGAPKMKTGLTSSLMLMATPVTYNEDQMVVLSKLIGDDDPKVRMNALGALQKINDPDTIRRGAEPMFAWLTNTRNPTGLHNAVGVLCEWDKDPALKDLKIKNKLSATSKLLNTSGDGWEKTLARIDAHLNPKSVEKK